MGLKMNETLPLACCGAGQLACRGDGGWGMWASERHGLNVHGTWFHLCLIYSYTIPAKWSNKKGKRANTEGGVNQALLLEYYFFIHLKMDAGRKVQEKNQFWNLNWMSFNQAKAAWIGWLSASLNIIIISLISIIIIIIIICSIIWCGAFSSRPGYLFCELHRNGRLDYTTALLIILLFLELNFHPHPLPFSALYAPN